MTISPKCTPQTNGSPQALFLTSGPSERNDNFERLPAAFSNKQWQVAVEAHESLSLSNGRVYAGSHPLDQFDLVWPVGFGDYATFYDRAQLLQMAPQDKLITSINAWLTLHGKSAFLEYCPTTSIAARPEPLLATMDAEPGEWVLKPCGGSFGRDVHFVTDDHDGRELVRKVARKGNAFYLLQRYLPAVLDGETRTLVADGRIIGSYLRTPAHDIRANVALDAAVTKCTLDASRSKLVDAVSARLRGHGVGFAAIDTVDDHLIEVNIANPGGLATLHELYGRDYAEDLVGIMTDTRVR